MLRKKTCNIPLECETISLLFCLRKACCFTRSYRMEGRNVDNAIKADKIILVNCKSWVDCTVRQLFKCELVSGQERIKTKCDPLIFCMKKLWILKTMHFSEKAFLLISRKLFMFYARPPWRIGIYLKSCPFKSLMVDDQWRS